MTVLTSLALAWTRYVESMLLGSIALWFRSECDARRVGFGPIGKVGRFRLQCLTTRPRQSLVCSTNMHPMDYLLLPGGGERRAFFEVSSVLSIRSTLVLANAISGDGGRLP